LFASEGIHVPAITGVNASASSYAASMRGAKGLALVALVASVAACGSAQSRVSGAQVFVRECAVCHSVIGNESLHRQGGDLLGYRMTRQQLVEFTREMPLRRPLTRAQLTAVVDYVFALQQRGPAR
jgi:mono/diheme cytochrome c family protein